MNRLLAALLAALLALFLAAPAVAQPNLSNLPANSVVGRLGIGTGPGQAIPFANLLTQLYGTLCRTSGAFGIFNATTGLWVCSTAGGAGSLATLNGSLNINPIANSLNSAILTTQSGAGSPGGAFSFNKLNITNDSIAAGASFVDGVTIVHAFGDVGHVTAGGRQALDVVLSLNAATNTSNANRNYVAGSFLSQAQTSDGGGSGTEKGSLFGLGPFARLTGTATNFVSVNAIEADVQMESGTSSLDKAGIKITQTATDAVSGSRNDSGLAFINQVGAVGWGTLIQIGDNLNQAPAKTSGSILAVKGAQTFAHGIDLSGGTCSTDCFKSTGFAVDGAGTITGVSLSSGQLRYVFKNVNFNSANTDTALAFTLPTGITRYVVLALRISNASASISTATCGLFTATGGGGAAIAATQAITVTATAADVVNNTMLLTGINNSTNAYNDATLQFRVTVAQGSAATADVILYIVPLS